MVGMNNGLNIMNKYSQHFIEMDEHKQMKFAEKDNMKKIYDIAVSFMHIVPVTPNEIIPIFCSHPFTNTIYVPKMEENQIVKTYNLTVPEDFEE